jgi:hypothetical protein
MNIQLKKPDTSFPVTTKLNSGSSINNSKDKALKNQTEVKNSQIKLTDSYATTDLTSAKTNNNSATDIWQQQAGAQFEQKGTFLQANFKQASIDLASRVRSNPTDSLKTIPKRSEILSILDSDQLVYKNDGKSISIKDRIQLKAFFNEVSNPKNVTWPKNHTSGGRTAISNKYGKVGKFIFGNSISYATQKKPGKNIIQVQGTYDKNNQLKVYAQINGRSISLKGD